MPDYQNGKIYTIRCKRDNNLLYVGSTTMTLSKRMTEHRYASYTNNIKKLYSCVNGNWDDWYIELYEENPCENKEQLNKREGEIIREIGTLNSQIAGRTPVERRKENWIENKELLSARAKECYQKHREERLEVSRQYNIDNNDKRKEYKKKYREEHKEAISAKRIAYYHEVQSKNKEYLNMKAREHYAKKQAKKTDVEPLNPV